MHASLDGVGIVHDADPGAEGGVCEAVAEAGEGVDDDEGWEGWVGGQDGVGGYVAEGSGDGDAALTELCMDAGVGKGSGRVACERRQKYKGDNSVVEIVICLK